MQSVSTCTSKQGTSFAIIIFCSKLHTTILRHTSSYKFGSISENFLLFKRPLTQLYFSDNTIWVGLLLEACKPRDFCSGTVWHKYSVHMGVFWVCRIAHFCDFSDKDKICCAASEDKYESQNYKNLWRLIFAQTVLIFAMLLFYANTISVCETSWDSWLSFGYAPVHSLVRLYTIVQNFLAVINIRAS